MHPLETYLVDARLFSCRMNGMCSTFTAIDKFHLLNVAVAVAVAVTVAVAIAVAWVR
jgi:hypothetical protein